MQHTTFDMKPLIFIFNTNCINISAPIAAVIKNPNCSINKFYESSVNYIWNIYIGIKFFFGSPNNIAQALKKIQKSKQTHGDLLHNCISHFLIYNLIHNSA